MYMYVLRKQCVVIRVIFQRIIMINLCNWYWSIVFAAAAMPERRHAQARVANDKLPNPRAGDIYCTLCLYCIVKSLVYRPYAQPMPMICSMQERRPQWSTCVATHMIDRCENWSENREPAIVYQFAIERNERRHYSARTMSVNIRNIHTIIAVIYIYIYIASYPCVIHVNTQHRKINCLSNRSRSWIIDLLCIDCV